MFEAAALLESYQRQIQSVEGRLKEADENIDTVREVRPSLHRQNSLHRFQEARVPGAQTLPLVLQVDAAREVGMHVRCCLNMIFWVWACIHRQLYGHDHTFMLYQRWYLQQGDGYRI